MWARSFSAMAMAAGLAACSGGGGGSGNTPQAFTGFSNLPTNGTTQIEGQAITANATVDVSGNFSIGTPSAAAPSTAFVTTSGGNIVGLRINANQSTPTSSIDIGSGSGDTVGIAGNVAIFESGDGTQVAIVADPATSGFEYQTLGVWARVPSSFTATVGAGSYGASTPSSGMPSSGTNATYNGGSLGYAEVSGSTYVTSSNVRVTTDFNTVLMESTNTDGALVQDATSSTPTVTPLPQLDFAGTGAVTGTGFSAPVAGVGVAGTANGQFYGPAAEEVGGTFSGTGAGVNYFGAFGATQ